MKRYTVWHSTGNRDGDASYDRLIDAERDFEDQITRRDVVEATLIDNDPADLLDAPKTLRTYHA